MPTSYLSRTLSRTDTSQVVPLNFCTSQLTRVLVVVCPSTSTKKQPKLAVFRNSNPVSLNLFSIKRGMEPFLQSESKSLDNEKSLALPSSSGTTLSSSSHGVADMCMGGEGRLFGQGTVIF
jgi:hypothetical protein